MKGKLYLQRCFKRERHNKYSISVRNKIVWGFFLVGFANIGNLTEIGILFSFSKKENNNEMDAAIKEKVNVPG